jgi:hypothetical protein
VLDVPDFVVWRHSGGCGVFEEGEVGE